MAQLRNSIITGDLRVTGTIYGNVPLGGLSDADDLKAIEGLTGTSGILKKTAANTWTLDTTNYTTNVGTITGVTGSDGLTGGGTAGTVTIQHAAPSQSPAKTTSAVYPITIDKYGHITAAGSAQTILTLGTGANNAAAGNHNHDSIYVNVGGDSMTGRLTMTSGKPINQILTGSGEVGRDAGASASPRYFPAKWTFNTGLTVSDGDIFTIKTPIAGHSYGVFMSIDGTHYYPIILNTTEKFTTHYAAGTYIQVIYESSGQATSITPLAGAATANGSTVSGGAFRVLNFYNTNTTYSAMSTAEIQTGTASSNRVIQARYLKAAFLGDTSNTNPIFKTGSSNGTISVYGTDIAVKGLGSAAYTDSTDYASADFLPLERSTGEGSIRHTNFEGTEITGKNSISFCGDNIITASTSMVLSGGGASVGGRFGNIVLYSGTIGLTLTGSETTYTTNLLAADYELEIFVGRMIVTDENPTGITVTNVSVANEKIVFTLSQSLGNLTNNEDYGLNGATVTGSAAFCNLLAGPVTVNSTGTANGYNMVVGDECSTGGSLNLLFGSRLLNSSKNRVNMIGTGLKNTYTSNTFIIGRYNEPDTESSPHAFVVGQGQNKSDRKNIFSVDKEGNLDKVNNITLSDSITLQYNSTTESLDFVF